VKICLINNLFKIYEGKQKLYVDILAEELSRENDVIVITSRPFSGLNSLKPAIEYYGKIKTFRFFPFNLYSHYPYRHRFTPIRIAWHLGDIWNPHSYLVVKDILKKEKPDVVHTMNIIGFSPSVFGAIDSLGYPHLHTTTDGTLLSPWANLCRNGKMISFNALDKLYIRLKRSLTKNPDAVAALSDFMLKMHVSIGYFKKCRSCVIDYPYRLSPPFMQPKSYSPFKILFVGNIVVDKGVYVLVEAFKLLDRNNVELHFAGNGPELQNLRTQSRDSPNIIVHGFVEDEKLIELYSQSNVIVVPSLCFEAGKASAFLESLPFGTPVVASTAGGGHEGIIDRVNGRIFSPGDFQALCAILQELIDNIPALQKMEVEALKSSKQYGLDLCIDNLLKLYEGLIIDKNI
jgi:glycosyltransferase involved in cell wall biosynthesis